MATKTATKTAPKTAAKTAARNPAAAAPDNRKYAKVQLAEGYTAVSSDYAEKWDYENHPLLTGVVVGDVREIESGKGKNARLFKVVTVREEDTGELFDVYESASLTNFFALVEDGSKVSIAFQGHRDTGKQSPLKVFVAGIREEAKPATRRR